MPLNFPDDTQRLSIIGSTGSGKTQAALWHLSHRRFDLMPWVVYDFKRDGSISTLPYARPIAVTEIPVKPGVYVVNPLPDDVDGVENQMQHIWQRGSMGIYIDEGYMVGNNNRAFRSLLTQGRSKQIPMIVLSQRPVWMDRFVFSESEFFQVFRLQHKKDVENVRGFVPADLGKRLPEFYSYYYDVKTDTVSVLRPVPEIETIHETFARRLGPVRQVI